MAEKKLRWRRTSMRQWREFRDLTLEGVAEILSQSPYNLDYTHNSLGRIENGKQMPPIALIEALAKIYRTDIDSLLNRPPAKAGKEGRDAATAKALLQIWDQAEDDERGVIIDVARRVAKTGT